MSTMEVAKKKGNEVVIPHEEIIKILLVNAYYSDDSIIRNVT